MTASNLRTRSRATFCIAGTFALTGFAFATSHAVSPAATSPFVQLMERAAAHAKAHNTRFVPALSPVQETVLGENAPVQVGDLQARGILVVPWTVDDPAKMRDLLNKRVDGIISDRPDLLMAEVHEAREKAAGDPAATAYLDHLDAQGHRGGRGLRPENTLPAFEAGMDEGITTIETDTGITLDGQPLLWHDQFLNPQSCRRTDGRPYSLENRQYIRDISMQDAQRTFVCDRLHFGDAQKNDLALSPVAVAFAASEKMPSPYAPTSAPQLFRFARFYASYYRTGAGRTTPHAAERVRTGEQVHFNLETKILPPGISDASVVAATIGKTVAELRASGKLSESAFAENHTVSPEVFVDTLCGTIRANQMEARADVQSFDFRTLLLVQAKYPAIRTYYLTGSPATLASGLLPAELRTAQ